QTNHPVKHSLATFAALVWLLCAGDLDFLRSEPDAQGPAIRWNRAKGTLEVHGLARADLALLAKASLNSSQWQELFAVSVRKSIGGNLTQLPPALGSYAV